MSMMTGWAAIVLVLFATVISIVPGAISVISLVVSMLAVVVSLFSIRNHGIRYFRVTISLALVGTFLVNDGLRVWDSFPLPVDIKIGLYGVTLLVLAACSFAAYRLESAQRNPKQ